MARETVLIVEDEERMRRLIGDYLIREGFDLRTADNGKDALEIFEQDKTDLVVLDIMMPGYDGWTVCREIRKVSSVPIIMLTARSEESDELFGFDLGADEYITKPFSPKILVARVKALLRRVQGYDQGMIKKGHLKIDDMAYRVFLDDKELDLSPKEYELLNYLIKHEGRALGRDQLLDGIWGYAYYGDPRTVDTHIKRLRIKLGAYSNYIQTVRGIGYRFEVSL